MNSEDVIKILEKEPFFRMYECNKFTCVIARHSSLFHYCGYVALPKGHKFYGKEGEEIDIEVHGGISYSDYGLKHLIGSVFFDYWWIGFDCGHFGDLLPNIHMPLLNGSEYRDFEFVKNEIQKMCDQLILSKEEKENLIKKELDANIAHIINPMPTVKVLTLLEFSEQLQSKFLGMPLCEKTIDLINGDIHHYCYSLWKAGEIGEKVCKSMTQFLLKTVKFN